MAIGFLYCGLLTTALAKRTRGDAEKTRILLFANWFRRNEPFQARHRRGFLGKPMDQDSVKQRRGPAPMVHKMAPGWTTEWTLCEDGVGGGGFALF